MGSCPSHLPTHPTNHALASFGCRQMLQAWLQSLCTAASTSTLRLRVTLYEFPETAAYYPPEAPVSTAAQQSNAAGAAGAAATPTTATATAEMPSATATAYAETLPQRPGAATPRCRSLPRLRRRCPGWRRKTPLAAAMVATGRSRSSAKKRPTSSWAWSGPTRTRG